MSKLKSHSSNFLSSNLGGKSTLEITWLGRGGRRGKGGGVTSPHVAPLLIIENKLKEVSFHSVRLTVHRLLLLVLPSCALGDSSEWSCMLELYFSP